MFARVYRKVREMRRKGTSFVALVALLASGFTFLEAPAPASAAIVSSNLVLNLDASNTASMAATGATGWNSVSPASSTATSTFNGNAARVSDATGPSMSIDGSSDAAVFPAGTARTPGAMTIETWVKPGNLRAGWNILASRWFPSTARGGSAVDQDWHFALYGSTASNIKLQLNTGAGIVTGNTVFPATSANKWYHLAVTIDASNTVTMWVNGVADGSSANFPHTDNATAQLHVGDVGADTALLGSMSRFRIYNAALTSAQMAQNFLTDSANYGYAPANTVVPTVTGTAKVGTALTAADGTWGLGDAAGTTTTYQWQSSTDGSTGWANITGATSATYTPVTNDALNYLRANVTKTNSAGSATASSAATVKVQTQNGISMVSSGKLTGLTTTVPNDSTVYNVTLATSNLSATMVLGTTTGLTVVPGYASTASYMASAINSAAPIITFRGAGTAINTALANVSYTSATKQVDLIKLYYATAGATDTDTKNYIPIYDNGQLTFHYYAYKNHAAAKNRADMDASLVGLTTTDNVQAPGPWYLVTPRYQIEWTRTSAIIGSNTNVWMGATSANGSTDWYWPANTDGYPSATKFAANGVGSSNIFNGTSTALPYCASEPNGQSAGDRSGYFYICSGNLGWDDTPVTTTTANFVMETYGTAPFNTGAAGSLAMTNSIVATSFDAPTGVTATATGTGSAFVSWTAPAANTTINPLNSHKVEYSTSAAFTTFSTAIVSGASNSSTVISGLTANTLYYFRVFAYGGTGGQPYGVTSAAVSTTTLSTATTITVVSTGGGVAGTDYTISKGTIFPKSGTSANVNASDIQTSLGSITTLLAADNVVISAPITWSTGSYLQLGNGSSSSVTINKTITSSGSFSQLIIPPTSYTLDVKNGASIQFTSASAQYLSIGGASYTLLKTEAQIAALASTTGNYALAKPLVFATSYTTSPINVPLFAGTIDGLGNTVNGMTLNSSTAGSVGFVRSIAPGAVIRNLGLTNVAITISSYTGGMELGALVGQSTGGTLDQVWTTGSIKTTAGATVGSLLVGGIVSYAATGTTTITKSWSSVSIDTSTATYAYLGQGGIIGADIYSYGQANGGTGGNVSLSQVYSIGNQKWTTTSQTWHGVGGIMGLHFSTATTSFTDVFSWSNLSHDVDANNYNFGGILGVSQTGTGGVASTFTNNYTTFGTCVDTASNAAAKGCTVSVVPGNSVSAMAGANWTTNATYGTYLTNVAPPVKPLFVQVVAPTDNSYTGITNRVLDSNGTVQTLSALNLSTSGTPVYSILSNAAKATYPSVTYSSGLTLGGTAAGAYTVNSWATGTSVTISRVPQTFTWSPTTSISFGSGTFTPSAAPVSSAGSTISYAVTSAGTTGCTVNATTGAVTYTSSGSCEVTATAAQTTDYTSASVAKTFVIGEASSAPTVTATGANTTAVALSWTTPTVNASAGITGYQVLYSTSSSMTSATTINTGTTDTRRLITGLTAGTTYYFQVRAVSGTTWYGSVNAVAVSAAPKVTATSITVVSTGGGTLGTDYFIAGGNLYTTNATANVNVADIQSALLTNGLNIVAENVVVNASIAWATSQVLTLGNTAGGSLAINDTITASGLSGGLVITPTNYALKVNTGAEIILSGASSTLSIGGNVYTLIRSTTDFSSVGATGYFALAKPLAYSTSAAALTAPPIDVTFTGTFDGLGNTVDRMTMLPVTAGMYGLFNTLGANGVIRNVGVTNINVKLGANQYVVGAIAGASSGGTIDQTWSTGLIKTTTTNTILALGGLVGRAWGGTLNISKSWSGMNIDSSTSGTTTTLEQGGIIGGNELSQGQNYTQGGGIVNLNQVYATGTFNWASNGHRGIGGLFGLHYNSAGPLSITDSFSWVTFASGSPTTGNSGGIFGVATGSTATITRTYQATATGCAAGSSFTATPSCDTKQTPGTAVSGISGAAWTTANGTTLANVATPTKQLFVKVVAPTNGAYNGITYSIVDGSGTAVTLSSLNLSVSGTPVYSIASDVLVSATPYKVDYLSGLTLGGTAVALYSLTLWPEPTSVTISKYPQTVTWTPTTSLAFGSGTVTPAAAVASGGTAISYAVTNAGTTGCTVNASTGGITYTRGGSCVITATAANSGNYLEATDVETFVIAEPATAPTASATTAGSGMLNIGWTTPTVSATAPITGYTLTYSTSSAMTSPTTVSVPSAGALITGLTAGTPYYFQVRAYSTTTWTGPLSAVATATPNSTATTINVVASGGGVAGTDYKNNGGIISATGTVNINASDIQAALGTYNTVQIAATNVNLNAAIAWSANTNLTLGSASASVVNLNSTISGTGNVAGVKILPTTYGLSVKDGAYIRLTGTTPTFNLGGTAYTVVNTVAGLTNVVAGTTWALTAPISIAGTTYTSAVKDFAFTGTMDGLGNTISGMTISQPTVSRDLGFYASLSGATVRNVGITNINMSSSNPDLNLRFGAIAGNGNSGATTSNVTKVWSTGYMSDTATSGAAEMGGIVGGHTTGTLNLTQVWSTVTLTDSTPTVGVGGIIGTNAGTFAGGPAGGSTTNIREAYSLGNVARSGTAGWYGIGGIIGVSYGTTTTISDVFSWGNINAPSVASAAGIVGVDGSTLTITNAYTSYSSCHNNGAALTTPDSMTNCTASTAAGTIVTALNSANWTSNATNGSYLVNLPPPTKILYVQVIAPSNGSYDGIGFQLVDSTGAVQTQASLNISTSGTPVYKAAGVTLSSSTARGTYSVTYDSGIVLGGTAAGLYSLQPWTSNTSVAITRLPQTITWSPTTAIPFKTGSFTPSSLATGLGSPTFTYAVTGQGTTGCTVNSATGVVSYVNAGTCTVTATAAQTTDYLAGTSAVSFVIAAAPTFTIVASGGGVSGTDYTVASGVITAASDTNINAADLVTLLGNGAVQVAGSVIVNAPITWSANTVLTLGGTSGNSVTINQKIAASGNTAGLALKPATYTLDTKTGASISLSGTTPTLSMGGVNYTLIKTINDLSTVSASSATFWALAVPLTYSTSITAAPVNLAFAGTFDGLGNTVSNMKLTHTANGATGFFKNLNNGTIRNLGVTNQLVSLEPAATTYNSNVGGLVGDSAGGTLEQVWTTGFLKVKTGSTYSGLALGGLIGDTYSGTLKISKSWSTLNMNALGSSYTNQVIGGILGADLSAWNATTISPSGNVDINQVYYGGDLRSPQATGITGLGGIMGAHLGAGSAGANPVTGPVSITDAFSWGGIFIATGGQYGGIIGTSAGAQAYLYTTFANTNKLFFTGANVNASSNSSWSVSFGATPGITFNSKWYSSSNGTVLANLPLPYKTYYVQVVAPTDGSYSTMTYRIASGVDTAVDVSSKFTIAGTPTYSIPSNVAISGTAYNVDYSSGLAFTFVGAGTNIYKFENYGFPTAVTISKYSQTISMSSTAPTTATVGSTYTLAGTASSGLAISYTIDGAPSTVCSISGSVVTFNALGTCTINANQSGNTSYLAAPQVQQSAISTVKGTPTLTFTSAAPSAAKVGGATYTPAATSSSPATVTYTIDSASSTVCEIAAGIVSFIGTGNCTVNANQVSGTNWNAATEKPQTFAVAKGPQTITWTSTIPTNAVVGGATYTVSATKSAGTANSIVYSIDSTSLTYCLISGAVVSFIGAGTCKVNASLEGDTKYEAATQVQQSVTVAKASQTVAFTSTAPTNASGNGPTYSLTGTGGASTSPLVFSADSSSALVCSVSGATVSFINIGNCVVNLNQAYDDNYNAATQVQQTIVVSSLTLCPSTFSGSTAYCTVQFPRSGTWTVPANVTSIDVLTVGGGGAGGGGAEGNTSPGGGGGGEVLDTLGRSVTSGNALTVTIGAGGTGGGSLRAATASTNGSVTTVSGAGTTITSRGGGAGGTYDFTNSVARAPGGAGTAGGGGGNGQAGAPPTGGGAGSVTSGGNGISSTSDANLQAGGGGGGAGGNGVSATGTTVVTAGAGGSGKASTITGLTYGGGGGGAKRQAGSGTSGTAVAGGGAGGLAAAGTAGSANTGGGGGGSAGTNNGANGGSGLVVIRYQVTQTVAFTSVAPTGLIHGTSTTYTPTTSGSSSGSSVVVTVDASASTVCSIASGVVSIIGAGTCKLNVNQAATSFYAAANQVQQSFTVAKADQTISYTNNPAVPRVGTTYRPTATTTGGGTVTYTIAAGSISKCSIAAGLVTFNAVGTCTILADSAATTNYNAAAQITKNVSVVKGNQTISFTSSAASPKVNTTYTPTATATSSGAVSFTISSGACSITDGLVSFSGVGDCVIAANQAGDDNWNAATQNTQTITVVKGDQTITFTNNPATPKVNTTYTPTATSTSGGAVSFSIADGSSSVCTLAGGVVSFNAVGSCVIYGDTISSTNWNAATQGSKTVVVVKGDQTTSFTSTATAPKVGGTYTPTATATGSGTVSFTISSGACLITDGLVSFSGVGDCVIAANQAGDDNWNAASANTQTITVAKGDQAISFTSTIPTSAVVDGSTYTISATGGPSGNAVTYSVAAASNSVCTISGANVSFIAKGSCVVLANQADTTNWNAAPEASQTIAVGEGAQAISFTSTIPGNAVVGGSTYAVTATGGASGKPVTFSIASASAGICSIDSGTVTFNAVGDCVVEANQAGNANYTSATQATQTITVGKGAQVILFTSSAPTNAVVDGSTYSVSATGGQSSQSVEITVASGSASVCTINSGTVTFVTAGDCVIEANQTGNDDWNSALTATQTITVGKGAQTVAFTSVAPTGVRVDDSVYVPTGTGGASTSAVTISIEASSSVICELNNGEVSFHAVGSCVLELNQAGDSNYVAASQVTQTITVAKGLQTITKTSTGPIDAVVAGATYTPTFNGGASGSAVVVTISSATAARCEILNGTISFISAGDCDVVVNQAGNSNYEAAPELTFTISVGKGSQAISWTSSAPTNAVVGGTTYTPTATGGATGSNVSFRVDSNTASVCAMSMGVVRFVGVGTCTVLANQAGNANYLAATQESQTFTVGQGIQTINFTFAVPTAVVDGASYTPVATGGATGNTVTFSIASGSSSVCTLAFGRISFQNVGTCDVEANQLGNTNYLAAPQVVQSITVGKGAQVVAFTSAAPSAKVDGTTYEPVVSGGASGNVVTLSIAPSSSSICSVNNGVISYQAVGSCVVQANQETSVNYEAAAQVTQTITVAKGVQFLNFTTTPPSLRPVQGTTYVPAVTYGNSGEPVVFTIGAEAASICAISNGTISFLAVGDCVLYADQAGNANYTAATRISQIFDITKGEQIVTITSPAPTLAVVDGATYTPTGTGGAGTKPTVFTATAESAGICSVLEGIVYFDGAGDCVIALNQAGDTNYNAATQKLQNISVGKGTQTITFSSTNTTATVDGATYTPTYTDGEGINPVRISVLGSSSLICEVNAGVVSFHAVGDCVIEATQAGDNNYEAAQQVSQTITVAKGNQATLVGHSSLSSLTLGNSTPTAVLSTTGGSGIGSVSWSVTPETAAYCSVTGDVVSGLASGYCDLVATKLGDDNYLDATATLSVVVSTGGQTPVRTSINETSPTFSEGKTLTLALAGGDGDGAIWFESLTTHVCNTNGGTTLNIYHSGTCTVIGHKDGDDNYEAVANTLSFEIAKATQVGVTIHIAQALTYSPDGAVSAALSLEGVLASGTQSFSVTSGSCTIVDGALSATEAGDCEVTASILGDDKYLDGTFSHTFTIAKAAQAAVTATLATNAPPAIAWNGTKVTTFNIAGGSGPVSLTANTTTTSICSVAIEGSVVTVTGIARGTCEASVSNAASANYLVASKLFSVEVLDLASAPTSVAATTPARNNGAITSTISWVAPVSAATRATVTGYKVQSRIGTSEWTDVANGTVDVSSTSLSVTLEPWSKYNFRVAATTDLDGETLSWANFDLAGDNVPDLLPVGGGLVTLSTTKAATTSGETVYVTGVGFLDSGITSVEISTPTAVFTAGIRAAALITTKTVPATVISDTKLSFVLPKITLPKGVTTLQATIKVVNDEQLRSDPIPLDYIPKKLAQTLTATLPPVTNIIAVGTPLISTATVISSNLTNPPVVTATPSSVCTATINVLNKLVITPVAPGKCSISVVVPGTPAYTVSATKAAIYTVKDYRTLGLNAVADSVTQAGVHTPKTFDMTSGLTNTEVTVVVGENAVEVPVTLNKREGTVLFTVDAASEAASRCVADSGDVTGLVGSITMNDLGTCRVTVTLPADDKYFAGTETFVIVVTAIAYVVDPSVPVPLDIGDATLVPADELAELIDPKDPDDPSTPPVAITLNPDVAADYAFGGEDGLAFDPATKKLNIRSRTPLVGTWTAVLSSPNATKKWFKIPGKIVKKVQTYTYSNICKLTLTVKKDPKLKKKVTRIIGAGCILSSSTDPGFKAGTESGWSALTGIGIQKIKVKYKRTRQYAKTGLSYVKKKGNRVLKNINRTWVIKIGRRP